MLIEHGDMLEHTIAVCKKKARPDLLRTIMKITGHDRLIREIPKVAEYSLELQFLQPTSQLEINNRMNH